MPEGGRHDNDIAGVRVSWLIQVRKDDDGCGNRRNHPADSGLGGSPRLFLRRPPPHTVSTDPEILPVSVKQGLEAVGRGFVFLSAELRTPAGVAGGVRYPGPAPSSATDFRRQSSHSLSPTPDTRSPMLIQPSTSALPIQARGQSPKRRLWRQPAGQIAGIHRALRRLRAARVHRRPAAAARDVGLGRVARRDQYVAHDLPDEPTPPSNELVTREAGPLQG